jgi:hypothetical protein
MAWQAAAIAPHVSAGARDSQVITGSVRADSGEARGGLAGSPEALRAHGQLCELPARGGVRPTD